MPSPSVSPLLSLAPHLATTLRTRDWCVLSEALPPAQVAALLAEAKAHATNGRLTAAATGRGDGRRHAGHRGDSTLWLDDPACGPAARDLLATLDALRGELNRALLLGLHEVEAHFAHYPPGSGYARHRDRFRSDDARVLSLVAYLNADWPEAAGGALRLHLPEGTRDVIPAGGTVAVFLSDDVEHEVLPATRDRYSVAAWFRRR